MASTPPQKKLRLLVKSKAKVESLFSRRRQAKIRSPNDIEDSDIEEEEPILSRINADIPDSHFSRTQNGLTVLIPSIHNEKTVQDEQAAGEKVVKAQKRMGTVQTNEGRQEFSFNMPISATSTTKSREALTSNVQEHQMHFRIEDGEVTFKKPRESLLSGVFFSGRPAAITSPRKGKGSRSHAKTLIPGPLDHLKLAPTQPVAPKIDQATEITGVADYIRPRIPFPQAKDKLYRNNVSMTELSTRSFNATVPEWNEVLHWVKDVEGNTAPNLTEHGDVPALSKPERVRVPVGARLGKLSDDQNRADGGDTAMVDAPSIGLPLHVQIKPKKRRKKIVLAQDSPDNAYTSSQRILNACETAKQARKRKRPKKAISQPSLDYVFTRTGRADFNIFKDGFLLLPELCLLLAANLPVQTLINLYSISKDFHIIVNQRFTTVILNQVSLKAPNAARCYPWRCFKHLCQPDPALLAQTRPLAEYITTADHGNSDGAQINIRPVPRPPTDLVAARYPYLHPHARRVPTFRWLHLAINREKVIHALYHTFAARGVPLPGDPTDSEPGSFCNSLHKLWFMFDIPDNPRRIQFVHTASLLSPDDLANILTFVVKLDMICNDPTSPEKRDGVRKLLMASCDGFDTILKVIRREEWKDELAMLRAWTRYGFQLDRENIDPTRPSGWIPLGLSKKQHEASKTVFGVPRDQVGILKREFWGDLEYDREKKKKKPLLPGVHKRFNGFGRIPMYLIRPEQLVLREVVRRGYTFEKTFLDAVLTGYKDPETKEDLPPRDLNGGRSRILEAEGEYDTDDTVAGLRALTVEEGGDPLLDLGSTPQGDSSTIVHHGPSESELRRRRDEKEALGCYMAAWKQEVEAEKLARAQMAYRVVD